MNLYSLTKPLSPLQSTAGGGFDRRVDAIHRAEDKMADNA